MKTKLFAIMTVAAALSAQAVQIEILTNGEGTTLDGWTNTYTDAGETFSIQTTDDGAGWFASSYHACQLWQTVTLSDFGLSESDIQGNPTVTASGIVLANVQKDNSNSGSKICNVKVYELDASGDTLHEHTIMDRTGELISAPAGFSDSFQLDSATRKLKYEINGRDSVNWAGYYGPKFRNCSLTIDKTLVFSFSFVSDGASLEGSSDAPPIAPRHGNDVFQGYYTEDGVQVYDENYEFAMDANSASALQENTTLYARWKAVPRTLEGGITRLVYRGVLSNFGEWTSGLKKDMTVKVYDSASATTPLWSGDVTGVPINPDGSFEAVFGNDELACAFASNDLTHVELTVGDALSPLAPRRAFASVASVNRALVAEGAASDIKVGTLGANALIAEKITAGSLEASGTVRVEGSVSVEVKPFDIEKGRETTIWRGAGVTAWGDSARVATTNGVVVGQLLWTADREGVAMVHCSGPSRSTLRIPATIQFVRPGDEVRAPTWESGEVGVTVWGYKK
ncbi:MAG: hypothetical protein IJ678_05905 [Kiritimatiellae bacterium]|nr:hypothetical protein [Kiritimatiellia bacterium]